MFSWAISKPKKLEVEAIVTRADGTVENLGVIAHWEKQNVFTKIWNEIPSLDIFIDSLRRIFKGYF